MSTIREQILASIESYSKSNRRIGHYILVNYAQIPQMTARELADVSQTSEATIARFVKLLGFDNYVHMRQCLRREIFSDFEGTRRFASHDARIDDDQDWPVEVNITKEIANLNELRNTLVKEDVIRAVTLLQEAPEILVIGLRGSAALAQHMSFGLTKLRKPVRMLTDITITAYEIAAALPPNGVVVVITFPRYATGLTNFMAGLRDMGKKSLVITDFRVALAYGDVTLFAPAVPTTFVGNHAAPLVVINSLLHMLGNRMKERTISILAEFEEHAKKYAYFEG